MENIPNPRQMDEITQSCERLLDLMAVHPRPTDFFKRIGSSLTELTFVEFRDRLIDQSADAQDTSPVPVSTAHERANSTDIRRALDNEYHTPSDDQAAIRGSIRRGLRSRNRR